MNNLIYIVMLAFLLLSCSGSSHHDEAANENDHHFYQCLNDYTEQIGSLRRTKWVSVYHSRLGCKGIKDGVRMDYYYIGKAERVEYCSKCMSVELIKECMDSLRRYNR